MHKKNISKKQIIITVIILSLLLLSTIITYYFSTRYGLFQTDKIDEKDKKTWNYDSGMISGTKPYILKSDQKYCWIMLHGYTSTPAEMRPLAEAVHKQLNDTVYVPLLTGHGTVPSMLLKTDAETWYKDLKRIYEQAKKECETINIAASSMSASLALRLAEQEKLGNIYLINPLFLPPNDWNVRLQIRLLSDILIFEKKEGSGINDPEGRKSRIAYKAMPLSPIKNSLRFMDNTFKNLNKVAEPVLIQHSLNDPTAKPKNVKLAYEQLGTKDKKLIWYKNSSHVLLKDYDSKEVITQIIRFEETHRKTAKTKSIQKT